MISAVRAITVNSKTKPDGPLPLRKVEEFADHLAGHGRALRVLGVKITHVVSIQNT